VSGLGVTNGNTLRFSERQRRSRRWRDRPDHLSSAITAAEFAIVARKHGEPRGVLAVGHEIETGGACGGGGPIASETLDVTPSLSVAKRMCTKPLAVGNVDGTMTHSSVRRLLALRQSFFAKVPSPDRHEAVRNQAASIPLSDRHGSGDALARNMALRKTATTGGRRFTSTRRKELLGRNVGMLRAPADRSSVQTRFEANVDGAIEASRTATLCVLQKHSSGLRNRGSLHKNGGATNPRIIRLARNGEVTVEGIMAAIIDLNTGKPRRAGRAAPGSRRTAKGVSNDPGSMSQTCWSRRVRAAPDDHRMICRSHSPPRAPEVARYLYPGGCPALTEESPRCCGTLDSYDRHALGYLRCLCARRTAR